MIPISDDFRTELQQQIRRPGHCQVYLCRYDSDHQQEWSYTVAEYYVKSITIHTTGDPLSRRMPTEECIIALTDYERLWDAGNPNGQYANVSEGVVEVIVIIGIETSGGSVEWSGFVAGFLDAKPTWNNYEARFHFVRKLATLTGTVKMGANYDTDLYRMATRIIRDADVGTSGIAAELADISVISHCGVRQKDIQSALLEIAVAGSCSLRTTCVGLVEIKQHWLRDTEQNPSQITAQDILEPPTMERLPLVRYEIAAYKQNPLTEEPARVVGTYKTRALPSLSALICVDFDTITAIGSQSVDVLSENNIASITYGAYTDGIEVEAVTRETSNTLYTIKVLGTPATPRVNRRRWLKNRAGTDDDVLEGNDLLNLSNVGSSAGANSCLAYRANYLTKTRDLYSIKYRGDPSIEAYDIIRVELPFYGVSSCIVLDHTFTYQNGFSGTLIVRRISDPADSQAFDNVPATDNTDPTETS